MHHKDLFDYVYIVMLVLCFLIRAPLEFKNKRIRAVESRESTVGRLLLLLVFTGSTTMPVLYLFTPWFDFADYPLPAGLSYLGIVLAVLGLFLFWKSHRDLGRQFSPMLELKDSHVLVSEGIYRKIRHPMYTAIFAIAIAQLLLIGNFVVGPAFVLTFSLLYCSRIEQEEKMMLDHFGSAYAQYQARTNRLFPSLRR
ncbi:protein-S-isoprenylcysteine O-methyltransferase Ste14 [Duganella sp. 1411]|uniref:protein-S-isoprenylcysteine O-methyltransferase n=1 Tax=Duganella sp. 1411 TaxID=2806572 RepID=UPI001AE349C9|nr:protein-S-isoprenylcysteine O-methyltransferase [Duganella sp. 1411]MBP1202391.1 protein-S-isoprenylcysteine O-methyltransferase Ste14 [Duganella sp. 1411]